MATPTIKTKIAMDGEKEYRAALTEINAGLRELKSEMDLTKTKFADNADSVEALTEKNDILERSILSQKEKLEALRDALSNSAQTYGEADAKTSAWKVKVNEAEAALIKLERELENSKKKLDEVSKSTENAENTTNDFSDAADALSGNADESQPIFSNLSDIFDDFAQKSSNASFNLGGLGDSLGKVDGKAAAVAAALMAIVKAVAEAEQKLMDMTSESGQNATQISNTAAAIGFTNQATQEWDYVLKSVGSSINEAQGDLSSFQEKMREAATGTGEAAEMFWLLNVSVTDQNGNLRKSEEVFKDVVNALQNMTLITERNAISSTLLGGTGEKLIPIYNKTTQELDLLIQKKHSLGILTDNEIDRLMRVSEAELAYDESLQHTKDTLSNDFAPAFIAFKDEMADQIGSLGDAATQSGLVSFMGSLLEIVTSLAPALEILGSVLETLTPVFGILSVVLGVVADVLNIILNAVGAIINLLTFDFSGASANWSNITGVFSGNSATERAVMSYYEDAMARYNEGPFNASGSSFWRGGVTWVGDNGPEPVWLPRGSKIGTAQDGRSVGGDTFNITISAKDVREFNDIVMLARSQRRIERMEGK